MDEVFGEHQAGVELLLGKSGQYCSIYYILLLVYLIYLILFFNSFSYCAAGGPPSI